MSELINVKLASIDSNPMRQLKKYPFNEDKIAALRRSINDVGLWESIIGRRAGNRIQIAFGHHRIEASRREKLDSIPIIVRDLTDEQMLQFMGRENLEDYNADFLVMLETWEAADEFLCRRRRSLKAETIDIARLLGWTFARGTGRQAGQDHINDTAAACSDASRLIKGGYMKEDQLGGLSVRSVREICARVVAQQEAIERMAKVTSRPKGEIEGAKRAYGKAGGRVAKDVRAGRVATKDIRGRVDVEAYRGAKDKPTPLFALFARSLADRIHKMLASDTNAEQLEQIADALGHVTLEEDRRALARVDFALAEHINTSEQWRKRLAPRGRVVPFKLLKDERQEKDYA